MQTKACSAIFNISDEYSPRCSFSKLEYIARLGRSRIIRPSSYPVVRWRLAVQNDRVTEHMQVGLFVGVTCGQIPAFSLSEGQPKGEEKASGGCISSELQRVRCV